MGEYYTSNEFIILSGKINKIKLIKVLKELREIYNLLMKYKYIKK